MIRTLLLTAAVLAMAAPAAAQSPAAKAPGDAQLADEDGQGGEGFEPQRAAGFLELAAHQMAVARAERRGAERPEQHVLALGQVAETGVVVRPVSVLRHGVGSLDCPDRIASENDSQHSFLRPYAFPPRGRLTPPSRRPPMVQTSVWEALR